MIKITQNDSSYEVRVKSSNKLIGKFIQEADGFFYFIRDENYGDEIWSDHSLIEIGTSLKEINRPWLEMIESEFNSETKAIIKFNGGRLAILCSSCSKIIKTGYEFTETEYKFAKGEAHLPPQYCENCKNNDRNKI